MKCLYSCEENFIWFCWVIGLSPKSSKALFRKKKIVKTYLTCNLELLY